MGGFLRWVFDCKGIEIEFPAPREVWVVSYNDKEFPTPKQPLFPSPLEVWVGSYLTDDEFKKAIN